MGTFVFTNKLGELCPFFTTQDERIMSLINPFKYVALLMEMQIPAALG